MTHPTHPERLAYLLCGFTAAASLWALVGLYRSTPPDTLPPRSERPTEAPQPEPAPPGQGDTSAPDTDTPRPVSGEETA